MEIYNKIIDVLHTVHILCLYASIFWHIGMLVPYLMALFIMCALSKDYKIILMVNSMLMVIPIVHSLTIK